MDTDEMTLLLWRGLRLQATAIELERPFYVMLLK